MVVPRLTVTVRREADGRLRWMRVEPVVRTRDDAGRRAGPWPLGARRCVVTLLPRSWRLLANLCPEKQAPQLHDLADTGQAVR
ncbi:hypothetical protein Ade02nite_28230 [Paractinoplanes deccanensis]|uniref:Uncharacterized protein n=1 Tax=Paractinoplanes deccanensis TaxID=113561 RepID=A0ABQ3Y2K0_9ACTN|nr:hypothetical protein Ade02nite_28230 [Actinoplanes deccanensis]